MAFSSSATSATDDATAALRTLIVAYAFPPVGGAGVQRAVKLAKYLPAHGVAPTVLTVKNPSAPVTDETLTRDVPPGVAVLRARTLEPGYGAKQAVWRANKAEKKSTRQRVVGAAVGLARRALVPDPQMLWLPDAGPTLARRLRQRRDRDDVVFITAPPFSQFNLGPLVRALSPTTDLVFDYRDEWSTARTTYEMLKGPFADAVGERMERALIRCAHCITTATEAFRDNLLSRFPDLDPGRVFAIPNGYDPDDYPDERPSPPTDAFVLAYAGTIFKLTSARGLLGAIRKLHARAPDLAAKLRVRFMGRIVDTELDAFAGTEALGVERLGYVSHDRVLDELSGCHLTLCILDEVPGVERIFPAKIFELMHLGRPVLTLSPPGALTRLVAQHGVGDVIAPRDEEAICGYLERQLRAFVDEPTRAPEMVGLDREGIRRYHRRALAGEFADVMRTARDLARR
ncbi:MAG: glycosyltransferase [Myxococcota bacterium]